MGSMLSEEQKRDLEEQGKIYFEHIDVDKYKPVRPENYNEEEDFKFADSERYEYARIVLSLRSGLDYTELNDYEKELFTRWNKS